MRKTIYSLIPITALLATTFAALAAEDPRSFVRVMQRSPVIFLAEIDHTQPGEACSSSPRPQRCQMKAVGRVTRVFQNGGHADLVPVGFEVEIPRYYWGDIPMEAPWSSQVHVEAGQQYLIFSRVTSSLAAAFEFPSTSWLITDREDAIGDLELILRSESTTLPEQVSSVSALISAGAKPRSFILAQYAAGLLLVGSNSETAVLAQTIENGETTAFSDIARGSLIGALFDRLRESGKTPDNALQVFVTMTARYIVDAPDQVEAGTPDIRVPILAGIVPWILGSEPALAAFHKAMTPSLAEQFRKKALQLRDDNRFRAQDRARLQKLAAAIQTR